MDRAKVQREWIEGVLARNSDKTAAGIADALGRQRSQGSRIAKGERLLKPAEIPLVEHYLGTRAPEALGDGDSVYPTAGEDVAPFRDETRRYRSDDDEIMGVPVYDLRAAAGYGAVAVDTPPLHHQPFRASELRSFTPNIAQLFILEIEGDSNWPTLHHGDRALCDAGQTNPRREGRYVIRIDEVLQVKLLSMHPITKRLTIKSDNPDYPTYSDIDPDEIAIVARVIWIMRRLV